MVIDVGSSLGRARRQPVADSFLPQSDQGIQAHRAPCRQINGHQRHGGQHDRDGDETDWVVRLHAKQQALQDARREHRQA